MQKKYKTQQDDSLTSVKNNLTYIFLKHCSDSPLAVRELTASAQLKLSKNSCVYNFTYSRNNLMVNIEILKKVTLLSNNFVSLSSYLLKYFWQIQI